MNAIHDDRSFLLFHTQPVIRFHDLLSTDKDRVALEDAEILSAISCIGAVVLVVLLSHSYHGQKRLPDMISKQGRERMSAAERVSEASSAK